MDKANPVRNSIKIEAICENCDGKITATADLGPNPKLFAWYHVTNGSISCAKMPH